MQIKSLKYALLFLESRDDMFGKGMWLFSLNVQLAASFGIVIERLAE